MFAFFLLNSSFSIPKLLHILGSSPCFNYPELLAKYNDILYSSLERIGNIRLDTDARKQASLPAALGGLGLGSASVLAVCGYLSSVGSSSRLCSEILNKPFSDPLYEGALSQWYELSGSTTIPENNFQKSWSDPVYRTRLNNLITDIPDDISRIRLKSFEGKLQSAWLTALPSNSLGLKLSNIHLRISLALRLGVPICEPHVCRCGEHVDTFGGHGLSCRRSAGRLQRHSMINDVMKRALGSSDIPSVLEPPGLSTTDQKRPDGLTLVPWERGQSLIWDATIVDALAPSRLSSGTASQFSAASEAENRKTSKYADLINRGYILAPVAFEIQGGCGPQTLKFFKTLGRKLNETTQEPKSSFYMKQRISIAIQVGNAASVLGTLGDSDALSEVYYLLK